MKATPEEYTFHQRLLAGDPTAGAEVIEWLYDIWVPGTIADLLHRAGPGADHMFIEDAVEQAVLDYQDRPEAYDPERATLRSYLRMAAYRDYQNLVDKERRRQARQVSLTPQPEAPLLDIADAHDDIGVLLDNLASMDTEQMIALTFPDPRDQKVVYLILDGERATHTYAVVLGLTYLSQEQQAQEVKRIKDRITKKLRRLGKRSHG